MEVTQGTHRVEVWFFEITGSALLELAWFVTSATLAATPTPPMPSSPTPGREEAMPSVGAEREAELRVLPGEAVSWEMTVFSAAEPRQAFADLVFFRGGQEVGAGERLDIEVRAPALRSEPIAEEKIFELPRQGAEIHFVLAPRAGAKPRCFEEVRARLFEKRGRRDQRLIGEELVAENLCVRPSVKTSAVTRRVENDRGVVGVNVQNLAPVEQRIRATLECPFDVFEWELRGAREVVGNTFAARANSVGRVEALITPRSRADLALVGECELAIEQE